MTVDISLFPAALHKTLEALSKDIDFISSETKGANGHVIFGVNRVLKRQDVIKLYYWENGDHAEPEILAKLEHPNILKVYHAASVDDDWALYTTKHCDGGDLDGLLATRRLGIFEAIDAAMMAAAGVSFLHGQNFIHRDLKPANIYSDSGTVVIGDFGSVTPCDASGYCRTYTRHSLIYRPPEALVTNAHYKTSDVYQLGILLSQLCGGNFPYPVRDWLSAKQKDEFDAISGDIEKNNYADECIEKRISAGRILDMNSLPAFVPESIKTVIRTATRVDHTKRFSSVAEMMAAVNNKKGKLPDWRVDGEAFVLHRTKKTIRVRDLGHEIVIEKDAGGGWRKNKSRKVGSLREAVTIAEGL